MAYRIGQVACGKFEVLGILPPLTFGELYKAHMRDINSDAVLLVLGRHLLPDAESRKSVVQKVGLARGLREPNLVWLYDVREDDEGNVVVATQWQGTDTLRARVDKRKSDKVGWPLGVEEAWGILQQVAYALVQLHRDAEVLGDLRASTVIVTNEGLKLFNHGVGCALPRHKFVEALERAGEDTQVAPEIIAGGAASTRADVYSLAALFHELVFGDPPAETPHKMLPTRPNLAAVLKSALNVEPFERPLSVDAFLRELQANLNEEVQPLPPEPVVAAPARASLGSDGDSPRTTIGEVKLPGVTPQGTVSLPGVTPGGSVSSEKLEAPSPEAWQNQGVTRELAVDDLESLLGKNETRQINLNEIESLLEQSKDPSLEQKQPDKPKEEKPRPALFGADKPIDSMVAPEDRKTGEMTPMNDDGTPAVGPNVAAANAPPPMWEDVRSQVMGRRRRSALSFVAVGVVVAVAAAWAGYTFLVKPGETPPAPNPPPAPVAALVDAAVAPSPKAAVPPAPAPAPPAPAPAPAPPAPAPVAAMSNCPSGMVPVPGGKPLCVDVFEHPGEKQTPRTNVSFVEAAQICGAKGGRLCTESEWERACKGEKGAAYPYGPSYFAGRCNTKGGFGKVIPSGTMTQCKSSAGTFDMSGNVAEWVVVDAQQIPAIKGGSALAAHPIASCAYKVETASLAGSAWVGFRCCKDQK